MKKVDTVGVWMNKDGEITSIVVNYSNGDVRNFPGEVVLPDEEMRFFLDSKHCDVIHLSDGKTLKVFFN